MFYVREKIIKFKNWRENKRVLLIYGCFGEVEGWKSELSSWLWLNFFGDGCCFGEVERLRIELSSLLWLLFNFLGYGICFIGFGVFFCKL